MSAASATPDSLNVPSQSGSAGPPSGPPISAPVVSSEQQQPQSRSQTRSYASATKTAPAPPVVASGNPIPPVAVPAPQHGPSSTMSTSGSTAMGPPPVVGNAAPLNGASAPGEHGRKPSVTIGATGASGYIANGGPVGPSAQGRNMTFGSMNSDGSPAVANNSPYAGQSSLATPRSDPRISSPAASPVPIPQPPPSGGRPPTGLQPQSNGLSFGSLGGPENDLSRSMHATPPGPSIPVQPAHLRRQSSQQSDMGAQGMQFPPQGPNRGQFMQGGGRGRGYPQGYQQQQMPYSPGPNYRPMPGQQRPGQGYPPQFQNQPGMAQYANSPHPQSRSPMPQGSHPSTPHMQHQQMAPSQMQYQYQPSYHAYAQHLGPQSGQFGQQPGFDPNYQYYQSPYQMGPQYLGQGPPSSPRPFKQAPPTPHQQFVQGQFNQSAAQAMSRTPSHASTDRPASSVGAGSHQPPPSHTPSAAPRSHTPSQSTGGGSSQQANFTIPTKRPSKGVVIKDDKGNIITFDSKGKSSPAPATAKSSSPSNVSAAPTPPPPSSTPHSRPESKTAKTKEEIRAEFMESVKKEQSEDKIKEEDATSATSTREADQTITTPAEIDTEVEAAKAKADSEAKAAEEKRQKEEAQAQQEKQEAEALATKEKEEQAKAEEVAAKLEADKTAKLEAEKAANLEAERAAAQAVEATKSKSESAQADAPEAETEKSLNENKGSATEEDDEVERMIAEMEAKERADDERERVYKEKKKAEAAEKASREKEAALNADEEMKRAEKEAEDAEEARQQPKAAEDEESEEARVERENMFAELKKTTISTTTEDASGVATPTSEDSTPSIPRTPLSAGKQNKPAALKLDTAKQVEPAQPTAGMLSLKSARMLQLHKETIKYPEGISSPNPALTPASTDDSRPVRHIYDFEFMMQFQNIAKEKPTMDWEQKLKDTIGDSSDSSAGPKSSRTPVSSRQSSQRGPPPSAFQGMGNFGQGGGRTLPPGTTSQARFDASNRGPTMSNPLANFAGRPGAFPMGNMPVPMARQGSMPPMPPGQSPRNASQRGRGGARPDRTPSRKEQEQANKSMPLTSSGEVKALELSKSGWKPPSVSQTPMSSQQPDPSGRMAPDMVQRKVKASLNKMTPERFDRISDQILTIAGQSKDESDGRTLRQIIALTFEKACDEAHWASMYAKFCARMMEMMTPEIKDENIVDKHGHHVVGGALFRKYLLNKCQEEFEQGWEVNLPDQEEGKTEEAVILSDEYYKATAAKRKGLGLIQFIGELYKLQMLSTKIINACFFKLLNFTGTPDEAAIESLVKLMRTVGATMEMDKDKQGAGFVGAYFERIEKIAAMPNLPSRMHFMLLDVIDLRRNGWRSKDDSKGPKTIGEIRTEAAMAASQAEAERQRQRVGGGGGGRLPSGRGDGRNYSGGMPLPNVVQNQVATDELRKLQGRQASRQASSAGPSRTLGPTSMFSNRNNSGRQGLGPGGNLMSRTGDDSGSSTRSASRKDDKSNTFSALAGLEPNEGTEATPATSPQVTNALPATAAPTAEASKPAEAEPAGDKE